MTTWTLQIAAPITSIKPIRGAASLDQADTDAAYTDSGERLDDTVQGGTGVAKSFIDFIIEGTGATTTALALAYWLRERQRSDTRGLAYRLFDGAATYILPSN
jgi:hypothetical protein